MPTFKQFNKDLINNLPDLFVLGLMLPDGNGLVICKELKADHRTSKIPVLLMSANKNKDEVISEACTNDFISKPFNIDYLKNVWIIISLTNLTNKNKE
jgi:two-component system phosphate regulon response regulator PhoB